MIKRLRVYRGNTEESNDQRKSTYVCEGGMGNKMNITRRMVGNNFKKYMILHFMKSFAKVPD